MRTRSKTFRIVTVLGILVPLYTVQHFIAASVLNRVAGGTTDVQRPRIKLEQTEFQFGTVSPGTVVEARFPIANRGTRRLLVSEQFRACGCLTGSPEIAIAPRQSAHLTVNLRTEQLSGPVRKTVRYGTNDPSHPHLTLTVTGTVLDRADSAEHAAQSQ